MNEQAPSKEQVTSIAYLRQVARGEMAYGATAHHLKLIAECADRLEAADSELTASVSNERVAELLEFWSEQLEVSTRMDGARHMRGDAMRDTITILKQLQSSPEPPAATEAVVDCETCRGIGTIDETLGGEAFANPRATCPDCDGTGEFMRPSQPPASEPGLLHGVPRDRAIWICSICNGWNRVRDKFCTHTHAANAEGGSPVNMLVDASAQPPASEPSALRIAAEKVRDHACSYGAPAHSLLVMRELIGELAQALGGSITERPAPPPGSDLDARLLRLPPNRWSIDMMFSRGEPVGVLSFFVKLTGGTYEQCECFSLGAAVQWLEGRLGITKEPSRDLLAYGYAPGNYMSNCLSCGQNMQDVDKRCRTCKPCAEKKMSAALGEEGEQQ